jgi:hypothetical protein
VAISRSTVFYHENTLSEDLSWKKDRWTK